MSTKFLSCDDCGTMCPLSPADYDLAVLVLCAQCNHGLQVPSDPGFADAADALSDFYLREVRSEQAIGEAENAAYRDEGPDDGEWDVDAMAAIDAYAAHDAHLASLAPHGIVGLTCQALGHSPCANVPVSAS